MIVRSASYSSVETSRSLTNIFGSSSSCCSLQQKMTSQQQQQQQQQQRQRSNSTSTVDFSFSHHDHDKHVKQSQSPSTSIPSSALAMGKELVCKCLQSTYSIQVGSNPNNNTNNPISNPWLKLTIIFLVSMKLQLLFEHSVCLLSLVATRYLAGKKRERYTTTMHGGTDKGGGGTSMDTSTSTDSRVPLVRTASSFCDSTASSSCPRQMHMQMQAYSSPNDDDEQSQDVTYECNDNDDDVKGYTYTSSSKLPPSAIELSDSQHSSASTCTSASQSQTWSQRDLELLSGSGPPSVSVSHSIVVAVATEKESPPSSSAFLPAPMDAVTDEWGQFTDFDDEYQNDSACGEGFNTGCPTGTGTRGASIGEDPFRSISKAILKRRGDKLSVCKLGQLQEEENEDDFD